MKKRTRSILDELRNIGRVQDTEAFIETTGSNIIEINHWRFRFQANE